MSGPADLFAAADEAKRERLRAAGWRRDDVWGREVWIHPRTKAGFGLDDAVAVLEREVAINTTKENDHATGRPGS